MKYIKDQYIRYIFSAGIFSSSISLVGMFALCWAMRAKIFAYSYTPRVYIAYMLVILFLSIILIVETVNNYRRFLREKKCEPHPRKQAFLLIWESVCLCANIAVFVFTLCLYY